MLGPELKHEAGDPAWVPPVQPPRPGRMGNLNHRVQRAWLSETLPRMAPADQGLASPLDALPGEALLLLTTVGPRWAWTSPPPGRPLWTPQPESLVSSSGLVSCSLHPHSPRVTTWTLHPVSAGVLNEAQARSFLTALAMPGLGWRRAAGAIPGGKSNSVRGTETPVTLLPSRGLGTSPPFMWSSFPVFEGGGS